MTKRDAAASAAYSVGETVMWASKIGPVKVEYRGRTGDQACVIVRESGEKWYQTLVPLDELRQAPPSDEVLAAMTVAELVALADRALHFAQCHKDAGPGFKGIRGELQDFVGDDYGPIRWTSRETMT